MTCPVCSKTMTAADFGGTTVDVCPGCKGLWFDWAELARLDEKNEGAGRALKEAMRHPRTNDAGRPRLNCPKCRMPMVPHKYDAIEQVNIDECYNCRGIFVDSGELREIRSRLVSRREEDAYLQGLLRAAPAGTGAALEAMKTERAQALKKWMLLLRSSYWLADKIADA